MARGNFVKLIGHERKAYAKESVGMFPHQPKIA